MKNNIKFLIARVVFLAAAIVVVCIFVNDLWKELVGSACGFLATMALADVVTAFFLSHEDKQKVKGGKFTYDAGTYLRAVRVGGKKTDIWYLPLVNDMDAVYRVNDSPKKFFELDNFLKANFTSIMQAHRGSTLQNPTMVRLDDMRLAGDGAVELYTSRTSFYNDLVTNRAMDYEFAEGLTVRKIFEGGNFLSPLGESRMSNHIGIIAHVFHGDRAILACRGGNATISKNKFTTCVAMGFAEDDVERVHKRAERSPVVETDDLLSEVLLYNLADRLNLSYETVLSLKAEGKIKVYLLGFGQLVYTGGKPQFYFTVVIDRDVDLAALNARKADKRKLDYNKKMVEAERIDLKDENGYQLVLKLANGKRMKGEAEKSFFIALWHMQTQKKIEGVPDWAYA